MMSTITPKSWGLGLVLGLAVSAPNASAQISLGDPACPAGQPGVPGPNAIVAKWIDVKYTGPSVRKHCGNFYNVFVPEGPQPPNGWPVMIVMDMSGFKRSSRRVFIDPDNPGHDRAHLPYLAATNPVSPMVVVYASGTVSRGGPTGNQIYNSTYNPWSTSTPQFGADYNGNGVFIPPGETPPNYSGGQTPYTDGQRPMPEKDAVMIIQHVKFHSGSFPPGAADPIQLDTSKIVAYGSSAGAAAMAWPVLGPDRAAQTFPNAAPGTQEVEDTRVPYAVLEGMPAYFGRFVQSDEILNSPMGIHFPVNPMSGGSPDYYDVPSRHLDQIANQSYQDAASPLVFGFDGQGGPIHTLNSQLKLYLGYSEASTAPMPICFGVDPDGNISSNCVFDRDVETAKHPSWSGHVWKLLYPTAHLVTTFQSAYTFGGVQPFTPTAPNRIPDKVLPNSSSVRDFASDEIDWLLGELNAIGTWTPLGGALAGVQGTPNLAGEGPLAEGTPTRVSLTNAAPNALSALVAGFSRVDEPFLGGVLIPDPQFLFFSQTTVSGRANTIATWPSVPAGTRIWFQQWTYDPSTFFGMSASNGLLAETP